MSRIMGLCYMKNKPILLFLACVVVILSIADFIQQSYSIRIMGLNVLNLRLWLGLFFCFILITNPNYMLSSRIRWVFIYILVYILFELFGFYELGGYSDQSRFGWFRDQHFPLVAAMLLGELYLKKPFDQDAQRITNLSIALIILVSWTSIILIFRNPGLVRGTGEILYTEEKNELRAFGLGSYSLFSALPFLIPVMVYKIKNRMNMGFKTLILSTTALITVLICSYAAVIVAPFFLSIIVCILAILGRRRIKANLVLLVLFVLLYVIIPKPWIASFFYSASHSVGNRDISQKLAEIGYGFDEGFEIVTYDDQAMTGIEGRASRIRYNLREFASSPLVGTGVMTHAAHIFWLGVLAQFGIIGIFPLIMAIQLRIKQSAKVMFPDSLFTYYLSIGAFIILGFTKVIAGYASYIIPLFIVPALINQEEEWMKKVAYERRYKKQVFENQIAERMVTKQS